MAFMVLSTALAAIPTPVPEAIPDESEEEASLVVCPMPYLTDSLRLPS